MLNVGRAEMYEVGPTGFLWTRYARTIIRGVQKKVFKTSVMRSLITICIILLAFARRGRAFAVLLIVPFYYLLAQFPLHTEYRYVLAIHNFLFIIAGATIYYTSLVLGQSVQRGYRLALGKLT